MLKNAIGFILFLSILANAAVYPHVKTKVVPYSVKQCLSLSQTPEEKNYCLGKPFNAIAIRRFKQWLTDDDYNLAEELLHDKNAYLQKKVHYYSEDFNSNAQAKNSGVVYIPDYKKAARLFLKSALKNDNALSANIYYSLTKSFLEFRDEKERDENYKKVVKMMYADNQCQGYVAYGDLLLKEKKVDKAIDIFRQGYQKCKNIQYFGMLLGTKITRVDFQKKLSSEKEKNGKKNE